MKIALKYWITAGVLLLFNILVYTIFTIDSVVLPAAVLSWTSTLLPIMCALLGVCGLVAAVISFKVWDTTKFAWFLLLLGIAAGGIAESVYFIMKILLNLNPDEIIPSAADVFWMGAYLPILTSLLLFINGYRKSGYSFGGGKKYIVLILLVFALAVGSVIMVFIPIFSDPETGWLPKAVYAFYPIFDFLILIPAAVLIMITVQFGKGRLSLPWKLIALGFLGWSAADIIYSVLSWQSLYSDGNFIDLLWNSSYLLMGAAGLFQRALIRSVETGVQS